MSYFYLKKPIGFSSEIEVSTVFMEYQSTLLLLQRAAHKKCPGKWCIPGGKVEKEETPLMGLLREIKEELSIQPSLTEIRYEKSFFVMHFIMNYQLHLFQWTLKKRPSIQINLAEHQDFIWVPISQFETLSLLEGQSKAFRALYRSKK